MGISWYLGYVGRENVELGKRISNFFLGYYKVSDSFHQVLHVGIRLPIIEQWNQFSQSSCRAIMLSKKTDVSVSITAILYHYRTLSLVYDFKLLGLIFIFSKRMTNQYRPRKSEKRRH